MTFSYRGTFIVPLRRHNIRWALLHSFVYWPAPYPCVPRLWPVLWIWIFFFRPVGHSEWVAFITYRDEINSLQIQLSSTQAGPGRTVKQEQEEISPNHVQRLNLSSVVGQSLYTHLPISYSRSLFECTRFKTFYGCRCQDISIVRGESSFQFLHFRTLPIGTLKGCTKLKSRSGSNWSVIVLYWCGTSILIIRVRAAIFLPQSVAKGPICVLSCRKDLVLLNLARYIL